MPSKRRAARSRRPSPRFPLTLLALTLALGIALGIAPWERNDWLLENAPAAVAIAVLVATWKRFPFSNISYGVIFAFLVLHLVGAHYTYSKTPYDQWFEALTGRGLDELLGFERNHYDRLVHFAYGFLIAYPMREVFVRIADVRGFWGYALPFDLVMSTSMVYELVEWAVAMLVGSDLGNAYLGSQGDQWDAQKDMALATLGAALSLTVAAFVHRRLDRDFNREWAASLSVKHPEPLGEAAIEKLQAK